MKRGEKLDIGESRLPTWSEAVAAGDVQNGDYMTYLRVPCKVTRTFSDAHGQYADLKDMTNGDSFEVRC